MYLDIAYVASENIMFVNGQLYFKKTFCISYILPSLTSKTFLVVEKFQKTSCLYLTWLYGLSIFKTLQYDQVEEGEANVAGQADDGRRQFVR